MAIERLLQWAHQLSDSKLNATESPKLFATEKKSHDIIVLLLEQAKHQHKLSVEFASGRIIRWQKRRFVVVDCTGFEAVIAREVGERRLGGSEAVIASRNAVVVSRQIAEHFRATRLGINR